MWTPFEPFLDSVFSQVIVRGEVFQLLLSQVSCVREVIFTFSPFKR